MAFHQTISPSYKLQVITRLNHPFQFGNNWGLSCEKVLGGTFFYLGFFFVEGHLNNRQVVE